MFEVGDWVRTKAGYIKQIRGVTKETCDTLTIGNHSVGINVVFKTEIELWKPKVGEWCWFSCNAEYTHPFLAKFSHCEKDAKVGNTIISLAYFTEDGSLPFPICEPFIGELPSFLKDSK